MIVTIRMKKKTLCKRGGPVARRGLREGAV